MDKKVLEKQVLEPMLEKKLKRVIRAWVSNCYGDSEAYNPSWDINLLAHEIATKLIK